MATFEEPEVAEMETAIAEEEVVPMEEGATPEDEFATFEQMEIALEQKRQALIEALLESMRDIEMKLSKLGYSTFEKPVHEARPLNNSLKRQRSTGPCKTCNFTTEPPHDARAHRAQTPKGPFTDEELSSKGYRKVE